MANLARYLALQAELPELFLLPAQSPVRIETEAAQIQAWMAQRPAEANAIGVYWEDDYYLVVRDLIVARQSGSSHGHLRIIERGCLGGQCSVAALVIAQQKILLLKHFRYPVGVWSLEIPRGFGEPAITPQNNLFRELKEEVAIEQVTEVVDLGLFYPLNGSNLARTQIYLVRLELVTGQANEEEIAGLNWVSPAEFEALVRRGQITDSFPLGAYLKAQLAGCLA